LGVLAAQLDGVHAERLGHEVHVLLDREGALCHAKAAESPEGGLLV
jgi:hypothetical protein